MQQLTQDCGDEKDVVEEEEEETYKICDDGEFDCAGSHGGWDERLGRAGRSCYEDRNMEVSALTDPPFVQFIPLPLLTSRSR